MSATAVEQLRKNIATCKEAADLLRRAEGLMRNVGYSIGIESATDTIDLCLADQRRNLGELLEKEPEDRIGRVTDQTVLVGRKL